MKRCLKMLVKIGSWEEKWNQEVQKQSQKLKIEGTMQLVGTSEIRIIACGDSVNLDEFIDSLYELFAKKNGQIIEQDPFVQERDYRGIFRII